MRRIAGSNLWFYAGQLRVGTSHRFHYVVNGAIGTIRDIRYEEVQGIRFPVVVYVQIPGAGRVCGSTGDDVVPIFPETSSFRWVKRPAKDDDPGEEYSVSRTQLPLLAAYAYTDYKAQGRSLDDALVDPASALSLQGVYVMLSRVRSLQGLGVLRPFPRKKIHDRLSEELRDEMRRLDALDASTRDRYEVDPMRYGARSNGETSASRLPPRRGTPMGGPTGRSL